MLFTDFVGFTKSILLLGINFCSCLDKGMIKEIFAFVTGNNQLDLSILCFNQTKVFLNFHHTSFQDLEKLCTNSTLPLKNQKIMLIP